MTYPMRKVLVAEDCPADAAPLVQSFQAPPAWEVSLVSDGQQALDYLFKRGEYAGAWRPDLFILNLVMPKLHGFTVLEKTKDTPHLAGIPVVIWTISTISDDIDRAYKLGAAAFVSKPVGDDEMKQCAIAIRCVWDQVQRPIS